MSIEMILPMFSSVSTWGRRRCSYSSLPRRAISSLAKRGWDTICSFADGMPSLLYQRLVLPSRQDLPDHLPAHVRQAEVPALELVGQLRVLDAEEVEEGGVQDVDVDWGFYCGVAQLVL